MKKLTDLHVLGVCLIAKLWLHFSLNAGWSFHRDELLYLALGRNLDWGYASVPPGIGFWAWLGGEVLGGSVWAVRLISTLFGTGTVLLTGLMAREFLPKESNGKIAMLLIGLTGLTCGAFLRPSMLFMPVVFDMFYWALLCWLFLRYINTEKPAWLLWFGAAAGVAMLNKYTPLIFLFAMLPGLLLTGQRRIFTQKKFYLAVTLALLILSPNIAWQAAHRFPLFRHFGELAEIQFAHVTLGGFLSDQVGFFLPALPIWLGGLYFLLVKKEAAPWRTFAWMFLMVLAVLLFFNAKSYYSIGAYPVLIAAGAAYFEQITENKSHWVRFAMPAFMLLTAAVIFPAALPLFPPQQEAAFMEKAVKIPGLTGVLRWEDGNYYALPQDFADMLGWEELAEATGKAWQSLPDKANSAIYAEHYGQAGAVDHFGKKYNLPPVLSFSDSYRYWLPDSLPANFHTLLYINDELGDDMPGFFQKIEKVWELDMPLSRQHGNQLYRCTGPTPAFFERLNTAIAAAKNEEDIED